MAALTYCYGTESGHSAGCQDHGTEYVGDLTRFQQPRGNGVSYTVDDAGNVTSQAYDGKAAATTHYAAGGHGLPDYAVDEVGDKTTYADYDANGLPRTVTDPRGNTGTTDPETSGIWRYDYDAVGNLLAVTDPRGTEASPGSPHARSFTYDVRPGAHVAHAEMHEPGHGGLSASAVDRPIDDLRRQRQSDRLDGRQRQDHHADVHADGRAGERDDARGGPRRRA
jgi:YD repeat-containing protein